MEKKNQQRRPSRPVSELITLFDHQKAERRLGPKIGQWRSENSLSITKPSKMSHKRNTTSSISHGNSELSKSSESVLSCEVERASNRNSGEGKTTKRQTTRQPTAKPKLKIALKPAKMAEKAATSRETPVKKATNNKSQEDEDIIKPPESLQNEIKKKDDNQRKDSSGSESESQCTRQKFPLDDSLAVLRREMHSLRKQDVELMTQLLALNSSIQEIKSHSSSSSLSNYSDTSDTETDVTEIEIQPTLRNKAWHHRESSGSDTDFEPRRGKLRPSANKQTKVNRDSLGSEVSGYYSNPSPRSSLYGSNRSLNAYDVSIIEPMNHSECSSPHSMSPVSCEPPFAYAYHCRQKTLLSQDFQGMGMTGSDPTLNRNYLDEDKLQPPVHGRACFHGDDTIRQMSAKQRNRLYSRRNTAQSIASDISRSGSEYSLSGYDVDSDTSRSSVKPSRLEKWQRSKSTCALETSHSAVTAPIKNTIKVDLRNNPPIPGTAIELILPIQPLQPTTRRSSAVRMAERRPLDKLNTLSKRQSTIW